MEQIQIKTRCTDSSLPVTGLPQPKLGARLRRLLAAEDGNPIVEMALIIPIFFMLFTIMFMFALALNSYLMLSNGVDIAARQLALSRGNTTDPCLTVSSALTAAAPSLNATNLSYTITLNGNVKTGSTCAATSTTTPPASYLIQGSPAIVNVTYPCDLTVFQAYPMRNQSLDSARTLTATTAEMVQ